MDLFTYSLQVLLSLDFGGILSGWVGLDLGCLCLVIWLALCSISRLLFLMLGGTRLQLIFVVGRLFRRGPLLDVHGSLQLLNSTRVRERDKALLRSVMVGSVRNGFLLGRVRGQPVPVGFVVLRVVMVTFFLGNAPFLLLLRFVKILSFMIS